MQRRYARLDAQKRKMKGPRYDKKYDDGLQNSNATETRTHRFILELIVGK